MPNNDQSYYATIFYNMTHNLEAVGIYYNKEFNFAAIVYEGTPYIVEVNTFKVNEVGVYQVETFTTRRSLLPSTPEDKLILDKFQAAYKKALDDYVTDVFKRRNAEYLPDRLKNYLLTLLEVPNA